MLKSKGKTLLYLRKKKFNVPDLFIFKANSFLKNKKKIYFNNKKNLVGIDILPEFPLTSANNLKLIHILN